MDLLVATTAVQVVVQWLFVGAERDMLHVKVLCIRLDWKTKTILERDDIIMLCYSPAHSAYLQVGAYT